MSDDSPLARLREAAARLTSEGGGNGETVPLTPRSQPQTEPRPQPEPEPAPEPAPQPAPSPWSRSASAPPAVPPPTVAHRPQTAPQPVAAWSPATPAPAPPAASFGPEPGRRTPLLVGGIVAAVLVIVLVVIGLVAMSGDDDPEGTSQGTPTTQVTTATTLAAAPQLIPESELYAPLPGYTFSALPAGALEVARSPFDDVPQLRGYLDDLSGRMVLRGGTSTAIVFVYQFNERFLALPGGSDEFIEGITLVSSEVQPTTIAGQEGVYFVYGSSHAGVAVLDGNVAVLVQGPFSTPRSRLEQITAAFLGRV